MDRRSALGVVAAAGSLGVAGCLTPFSSGEPQTRQYRMELVVQNDHDRRYDVRIVVDDDEGSTVFDQSFTIDSGEGRGFENEFPAGEYTITVALAGRSESRSYWNTDLCEVHRVRAEIASDGHVSHEVACHAEGVDPPIGGEPQTESN